MVCDVSFLYGGNGGIRRLRVAGDRADIANPAFHIKRAAPP